jgi:hypothetical protein
VGQEIDITPDRNRELTVRELGKVATELSAQDIKLRLDKIIEVQREAMTEGVDFGVIPGTEGKDGKGRPTLLKPGAEKLCVLFRLDVQFTGEGNKEIYHAPSAAGVEHMTVMRYCTIFSQVSGERLGGASAMCSSRESKYRYRRAGRACPNCHKETILRSKYPDRETGDMGWYCFAKKGGCGANYESGDQRITSQTEGRVENEDVADQFNTIIRMAEKRAMTAAVRLVTGASAIFDEEMPDGDEGGGAKQGSTGATVADTGSKETGAGADASGAQEGGKKSRKKKEAGAPANGNGAASGDQIGAAELKVLEGLFEQVKFESEENKNWYKLTICKQFRVADFSALSKPQFDTACMVLKKKLGQGVPA